MQPEIIGLGTGDSGVHIWGCGLAFSTVRAQGGNSSSAPDNCWPIRF